VKAEDDASRQAEREHPSDPTKAMLPGDALVLNKETTLASDPEPTDAITAIKQLRTIPADVEIRIQKVYDSKGTHSRWYSVDCFEGKRLLGSGWINSHALSGQSKTDWKEQLDLQSEREEMLANNLKNQVSVGTDLSREVLDAIEEEGIEKNWPFAAKHDDE
jgi:hypothetical protein